jgi:hypothetical protein
MIYFSNINSLNFNCLNELILNDSGVLNCEMLNQLSNVTRFSLITERLFKSNILKLCKPFFERLEYLEILVDATLFQTISMPKLKFLKCYSWFLEDNLEILKEYKSLETLIIYKNFFSYYPELKTDYIINLPKLRNLCLIYASENNENRLQYRPPFLNMDFMNFSKLEKLKINNCFPSNMPEQNNLNTLILKKNISLHDYQIYNLTKLEVLDIKNNPNITDKSIQNFHRLKSFNSNFNITDYGLKNLTSLTELNLCDNLFVSPVGISHLKFLRKLAVDFNEKAMKDLVPLVKNFDHLQVFESTFIYISIMKELIQLPKIAFISSLDSKDWIRREIQKKYEKHYERYLFNKKAFFFNEFCEKENYFATLFKKVFSFS